jgi:tetratricopeptide (TPR) repeat protein
MLTRTTITSFIIVVFTLLPLRAQQTLSHQSIDHNYYKGLELYEKKQYAVAMQFFDKAIDEYKDIPTELKSNASYYRAMCAMGLFNEDAEYWLFKFISEYPSSPKINSARFQMGLYQYNSKHYKDALEWFKQVDPYELGEDKSEYYFKKGYAAFMQDDYSTARVAFFEIKDVDTKYTSPAIYYYAHINYEQENYETALNEFRRLTDDPTFSPIVPYYISQIYYLQKKYDKVISYAPPLLETVTESRKGEMARIIGDSYFHENQYKDALEYLKIYDEETAYLSPSDNYQFGFIYYKLGDYNKATSYLEKASNQDDTLSQNALYHLADCYIKLGEKNKARLAFSSAAHMDYNPVIKEDALFNYALLTFELSYSPFNEALRALNEYIEEYPNSSRTDEAYNYLVLGYMNTHNYKQALASLEKIKNKDARILKAYQRIAYYRGLELFNDLNFNQAIEKFNLAIQYGQYDRSIKALAHYWKAEAQFRLGNYDDAINSYQVFILSPGAFSTNEYKLAHYDIAYAWFKKKNYDEAATWFRKYIDLAGSRQDKLVGDAFNRLGDTYFARASYWPAIEEYDKAIQEGGNNVDYAMFQKAFSLGLVNRPEKKIAALNELISRFPQSGYYDDALFELGRSYVVLQQPDKAVSYYNRLISDFPESSYKSKAILQLGLIYYNKGDNPQAIRYYKMTAEQFPGTSEARNALTGLKNIYVEMNDVNSYFSYVKGLGEDINISTSEKDSLTYVAAENIYMSGNCDRSINDFENYLQNFPDGSFALNAHFYLADCYHKTGQDEKALEHYKYVIDKPVNLFTEQALQTAASLYYEQKNYPQALETYLALQRNAQAKENLLKARVGIMRCYFKLERYADAIDAADKVLAFNDVSGELRREATFVKAKSELAVNDMQAALKSFKKVAVEVSSEEGAESKFRVAEIYNNLGDTANSVKEIYDFIDKNTPHQYWMARSFLLLADIFEKKNDNFQAVHTLQSIIDYYEKQDDGIIDTARAKKQAILEKDEELRKQFQLKDMEIDIDKKNEQ